MGLSIQGILMGVTKYTGDYDGSDQVYRRF